MGNMTLLCQAYCVHHYAQHYELKSKREIRTGEPLLYTTAVETTPCMHKMRLRLTCVNEANLACRVPSFVCNATAWVLFKAEAAAASCLCNCLHSCMMKMSATRVTTGVVLGPAGVAQKKTGIAVGLVKFKAELPSHCLSCHTFCLADNRSRCSCSLLTQPLTRSA